MGYTFVPTTSILVTNVRIKGGNCSPRSSRFCRLAVSQAQKPRSRKMSARSKAVQGVYLQLSFSTLFRVHTECTDRPHRVSH